GRIGTPMTAEQMAKASDQDIVSLFRTLTDDTDSNHPKDWLRGGSAQASQEFRKLAKDNPRRAVRIINQFIPGKQEPPTCAALMGIAEGGYEAIQLYELIQELHTRGFRSEEFRVDAAQAMEYPIRREEKLPPETICELLEGWLSESWKL